jgi:hypothetical protein
MSGQAHAAAEWYTPQEVGQLCGGVSAEFIRREIRAGQLKAVYCVSRGGKIGRFRIAREDAVAYRARLQWPARPL